jgi:lipoyl synthase
MKPAWLNKKINLGACASMKGLLRGLAVETVCEQALCPNMAECFSRRQATFLILGRQCTRQCSFCNIEKGLPAPVDPQEPGRVAEAVARLGLSHVVVTSVTRDDLGDGGAAIFSETVKLVRKRTAETAIEILIPDFSGSSAACKTVVHASPDIIAHNVETVPSLYPRVRRGADYRRSLDVLRAMKELGFSGKTKSGIMLGLGETQDEVMDVMGDLRAAGCDFLSIGQYLAPSSRHYPVNEFIQPEQFDFYKKEAGALGFLHVESGPYVRSSYAARDYLSKQ